MKRAALALVLFSVFSAAAAAQVWFPGSFEEALAKAKAENKLVIIDFYSDGWGGCRLLGEQFYENPAYASFLKPSFILLRADRDEEKGAALFATYAIRSTPTALIMDGDGAEIDWIVGYSSGAPDRFQAKVKLALDGVDTVRSLTRAYAANPKDTATVFKLGEKYRSRAMADKAAEKFREVLALDPEGKAGTYKPDYMKAAVPYKDWAEYQIAYAPLTGKRDPAPMRAFIKAHPAGEILRQAYSSLEIFFIRSAAKEEALAFYEEYAARFPNDTMVLYYWLQRIMTEKGPYDKGRPIAERIRELTENAPEPFLTALVAQFYVESGDKAKAEEVFGPAFADSLLSSTAFGLLDYADFWIKQGIHQDSARAMAEAAVKVFGQNPYILQSAADVFLSLGEPARALELFGPGFVRSRWDQPGELRSYVWFWTQKGLNLDSALAACKRALDLRPRAYYHWQAMADVLLKMKDYGEAVQAAEKAVEFASAAAKPAMQKNLEKIKAAAATDKK